MKAEDLLALYHERSTAEGHFGESKSVLEPALSSAARQKSPYRGSKPRKRPEPVDSFAQNEVILLLHAIAYNVMHAARLLMEQSTGDGWSLLRLRERVLRVAARTLLHARRVVLMIGKAPAKLWADLWRELQAVRFVTEG